MQVFCVCVFLLKWLHEFYWFLGIPLTFLYTQDDFLERSGRPGSKESPTLSRMKNYIQPVVSVHFQSDNACYVFSMRQQRGHTKNVQLKITDLRLSSDLVWLTFVFSGKCNHLAHLEHLLSLKPLLSCKTKHEKNLVMHCCVMFWSWIRPWCGPRNNACVNVPLVIVKLKCHYQTSVFPK